MGDAGGWGPKDSRPRSFPGAQAHSASKIGPLSSPSLAGVNRDCSVVRRWKIDSIFQSSPASATRTSPPPPIYSFVNDDVSPRSAPSFRLLVIFQPLAHVLPLRSVSLPFCLYLCHVSSLRIVCRFIVSTSAAQHGAITGRPMAAGDLPT